MPLTERFSITPVRRPVVGLAVALAALVPAVAGCNKFVSGEDAERGGEAGQPSSNACDALACGEGASCELVEGAPTCVCQDGYENGEDGCLDVDECSTGQSDCDEQADCINEPGSHKCTCKEGFYGTGLECRPVLQLVSVSENGLPGNGTSSGASASDDGRFVVFTSTASNLVSDDTNEVSDVFVKDMVANTMTRVSVSSVGTEGNGPSENASISADGRYIAFSSRASNLVSTDDNGVADIFVHDRVERTTTRVSVSSAPQTYQANGASGWPQISADGQTVVFTSSATNLAPSSTNSTSVQVFTHDLNTRLTEAVSVTTTGTPANGDCHAPSISGDGRLVTYFTSASNLVTGPEDRDALLLTDRSQSPPAHTLIASNPRVALGEGVRLPGFRHDSRISADGARIAFGRIEGTPPLYSSNAFVWELAEETARQEDQNSLGTLANGSSGHVGLSSDGRLLVFTSAATNLVRGDSNQADDVFIRDLQTGKTVRASIGPSGEQADGHVRSGSISSDGKFVTFQTAANSLGYSGGAIQVYLRLMPQVE
jgi:Tol biopolymer transport system component